jgi:hypothetical protein
MAKYVVNSRLSFARNFILAENNRLRSSPLLQAATRWRQFKLNTMGIKHWINKEFNGSDFTGWNYDQSATLEELEELGYPYSTACIELDDDTVIAVDCGEESPRDFIEANQATKFILDAFKHPRRIDSFLGNVTMFYAKPLSSEKFIDNQYGRFALDIFKNESRLFGAPRIGNSSPMMVNIFFSKLEEKLAQIRISRNTGEKIYNYEEKEIGSASFQVDFMKDEPLFIISYETSGITYNEFVEITEHIYKSIPGNRK